MIREMQSSALESWVANSMRKLLVVTFPYSIQMRIRQHVFYIILVFLSTKLDFRRFEHVVLTRFETIEGNELQTEPLWLLKILTPKHGILYRNGHVREQNTEPIMLQNKNWARFVALEGLRVTNAVQLCYQAKPTYHRHSSCNER